MPKLLFVAYIGFLIWTGYRILFNTRTPAKALIYLGLISIFPVIGVIIYYLVGTNTRVEKMYNVKALLDTKTLIALREQHNEKFIELAESTHLRDSPFLPVAQLMNTMGTLTSPNNRVKLLINGEEKFADVLKAISEAKKHIHIEYYIYESDYIGQALAEAVIKKAKEGVEVRITYDEFGSKLSKEYLANLRASGVQILPFYKILFPWLANRLNYRNHRKIIVIDGIIGYVGGINISDKYINDGKNELFWRDTHLKIVGEGVKNLQYLFLSDWVFASKEEFADIQVYFPETKRFERDDSFETITQLAYSGPDCGYPMVMYSLIQAIQCAREEILITTPYFIPDFTFKEALKITALRGVKVKLLVPGDSDSFIVNAASKSYYGEMMAAGIEIFKYKKGFVHAKTMVCDNELSVVGTANLDERSFHLNFEVNALVYDETLARQLKKAFYDDLNNAEQVDAERWSGRGIHYLFIERITRLLSPLL